MSMKPLEIDGWCRGWEPLDEGKIDGRRSGWMANHETGRLRVFRVLSRTAAIEMLALAQPTDGPCPYHPPSSYQRFVSRLVYLVTVAPSPQKLVCRSLTLAQASREKTWRE